MVNNTKIYIKYNIGLICKKILQEQLDKLALKYSIVSFTEAEINETVTAEQLEQLNAGLQEYGIEVVETHKSVLVQKIKDAIIEMIYMEDKLPTSNISAHLASKLNYSYGYIYNLFSEVTYTSIEKYITLQKIERAKEMIVTDELTCTEIAWKLNFSSTAHFSTHFKNATGLTPSAFQRIIRKRRAEADQG